MAKQRPPQAGGQREKTETADLFFIGAWAFGRRSAEARSLQRGKRSREDFAFYQEKWKQ